MRDQDSVEKYSFTYTDTIDGRNISYEFAVTDDTLFWSEVHSRFLDFLSSVYGYDIRKEVTVRSVLDRLDECEQDEGVFKDDEQLDMFDNYGGNDE